MSQRKRQKVQSQKALEESSSQSNVDLDEIANNVVRYIIYRGGEHVNFGKSELIRNVIYKPAGKYEEIMAKVQKILRNVYGYNLMMSDSTKAKDRHYIVSNILPYVKDPAENIEEVPEDIQKVLLLLILSHIFMSNNAVTDVSLFGFLKSLNIDVELKHPIFGNVKDYITKVLIKKHYLAQETDSVSRKQTFSWGIRAEKEISKMAVLDFICKIYKDKKPKDWVNQYQIATEQAFENHPEDGEESQMEQ